MTLEKIVDHMLFPTVVDGQPCIILQTLDGMPILQDTNEVTQEGNEKAAKVLRQMLLLELRKIIISQIRVKGGPDGNPGQS